MEEETATDGVGKKARRKTYRTRGKEKCFDTWKPQTGRSGKKNRLNIECKTTPLKERKKGGKGVPEQRRKTRRGKIAEVKRTAFLNRGDF